ncbi:MAG: ROK family protein [Verrucomicrobiae bacterium]|nr:ROK family protein [Verrucomicrobiae bacterium]
MPVSVLGIEIGGTKLQVVAGDGSGRILARTRDAVDPAAGGAGIRTSLSRRLPGLLQEHGPVAVGVGFGGPVDWRTGRIGCSHQISGWNGFELGAWLYAETGLPVHVDNDANVAALGEAICGSGRGASPVFWINMGSGVGGGLVVDGRIYHGAPPGEAEIGHLCLDKSGVRVEARCSGWAVDRRIREAIRQHPEGPLATHLRPVGSCESRALAPALADGDPLAQAILSELADNLAFALSHAVQLFHPEVIVIGGGLSLIGEPLRAAIAAALPAYVMNAFLPGPRIALAGLGEDSVPVGALALAAGRVSRVVPAIAQFAPPA